MVARAVAVWRDPRSRQVATVVLLLVGLLLQLLMVLVAAYLVDLAISLMDLWVELARKHLELTL
jgi:type III secretory pathway component EscU